MTLKELERLEKEATAGPWEVYADTAVCGEAGTNGGRRVCDGYGPDGVANARLIAVVRNILPELLASQRNLVELLRAVEKEIGDRHIEELAGVSMSIAYALAAARELEGER